MIPNDSDILIYQCPAQSLPERLLQKLVGVDAQTHSQTLGRALRASQKRAKKGGPQENTAHGVN